MRKRISSLKPHPINHSIYGQQEDGAIRSLADNIAKVGLLEPILCTNDGTILSGHQRVSAYKMLGKKTIETKIVDVPADDHVFYIISANKQRVKNYVVRVAEIESLTSYYSKGSGYRSDLHDEPESSGHTGRRQTTRQRIAQDLGIAEHTIHQLNYIRDHRKDALPYIGQHITLAACYTQVKLWVNQKAVIRKKPRKRPTYRGSNFVIYNKSSIKMKELDTDSVSHVMTSPPYYQQRFFGGNGEASKRELGQEATVSKFIDNLIKVFGECKRVVNEAGSIFINMNDTYRDGNKLQIPERLSIAIQDELGLVLRNTLIWWKNTSMSPESTKRRRHTDYEYVYHFVLNAKGYYYDADEIRIPYTQDLPGKKKNGKRQSKQIEFGPYANGRWASQSKNGAIDGINTNSSIGSSLHHPLGKIPGCILDISRHTKPLRLGIDVEHTAAYPEKLVREVMKPVIQKDDVILDPFSGSATTGAVALEFGCRYVGFDSNSTFCELGRERLVRLTK